jgi:GntR family transcriptional regulator
MAHPVYRRIADDLQQQIESGAIAPGSQLPPEPELRTRYAASRNTVRGAIRWLTNRRLVETRPGEGTFVTQPIDPFITTLSADPETGLGGGEGRAYLSEVAAGGRRPSVSEPQVEVQNARGLVAAELQLEPGSSVVSRHQQRCIDNLPYSMQTSFYPMTLVNSGASRLLAKAEMTEGTVSYLRQQLGVEQAGYRDRIAVRVPDENETAFFRLPEDGRVAVFVTHRTAFDKRRTPFRLTISVFPADRNRFLVLAGTVPGRGGAATAAAGSNGTGSGGADHG